VHTHTHRQTDPRAREKRSEIALEHFRGSSTDGSQRVKYPIIAIKKEGVHPSISAPGRARHFAPRCKARLASERYVDAIGDASDATRSGRAMRSETFYFFLFRRRPRRGRTDVARDAACTQSLPSSCASSSRRFARRRWKDGMNDASNPFVDVDAVRFGNTPRMISWEYRTGGFGGVGVDGSASTGRRRRLRHFHSRPFRGCLATAGGWMGIGGGMGKQLHGYPPLTSQVSPWRGWLVVSRRGWMPGRRRRVTSDE
jgi:hypothetical protein